MLQPFFIIYDNKSFLKGKIMCKKESHQKTNIITTGILLIILFTCSSCNVQISVDEDNVTVNGVKLSYKRTIHLEQVYDTQSATIKLGSGDMDLTGQKENKISLDIVIFEKEPNDADVSFVESEIATESKGNYPVYISSIKGYMPESISLKLSTGSGDITLHCFHNSSEISVTAGSGDITINGCTNIQNIDDQTGSGDILFKDLTKIMNVTSNSGSGDVSVKGSVISSAYIETGSGDIEISKTHIKKIITQTGSGDIILSNSTYDEISFDTGSGDVIQQDTETK